MATGAAAPWSLIYHAPGNPQLPTLPNPSDPKEGIADGFGYVAGVRSPRVASNVLPRLSAAPGDALGFALTWLNGIGANLQTLDFGNITAPKQLSLTIHNTNRFAVDVTAIDLSAVSGVTLISPALPVTVPSFDSVVLTFEAALIGDNDFDADAIITTDTQTIVVRMIGRRVIVFNVVPQREITEQVEFLTDAMTADAGNTQAMSLRAAPRSIVSTFVRISDDDDRGRITNLILGAAYLLQAVQLWWQSREVTASALSSDTVIQVDTENMEIEVDGLLSFVLPNGTAIEGTVASYTASAVTLLNQIGTALPIGTSVMPLKLGYMAPTVSLADYPTTVQDMQLRFKLIDYVDIGAVDPAYFDTHPVDGLAIVTHPLYFSGQTRAANITSKQSVLDSKTGDLRQFRSEPIGRPGSNVLVHIESLADQHAWRKFLHWIRGSWRPFYVPTGTNDLPLAAALSLGGNTFDIANQGLTTLVGNQAPRRDVKITAAGVVYYRRITAVADNVATEQITLDSAIPGAGSVPAASVKVEYLHLVRIVGDVATFKHKRRGDADLLFNIRGVIV
jgi:hypothetical protein